MFSTIAQGIVAILSGGVKEMVSDWQRRKKEEKAAQHERKMEVIKGDQAYDIKALEHAGWKDEYLLVLFSWPFIGYGFGAMMLVFDNDDRLIEATNKFFELIKGAPEEYWYVMGGIIISVYGLKDLFRGVVNKISK